MENESDNKIEQSSADLDLEEVSDEGDLNDEVKAEKEADVTQQSLSELNEDDLTSHSKQVDELSIATEMFNYVMHNKVNLAELDSLVELWEICDAVSAAHGGLPDSLLKEAFLNLLESQYQVALHNSWMRTHLDKLIRMWKKEVNNVKPTHRPTKFISASEQDLPPPPLPPVETKKRKVRSRKKKALTMMMAVGDVLNHARKKFATEEGELDVEEDAFGNFKIAGMELSFEAWGKINQIKDNDIVVSNVEIPQKQLKRKWRPKPLLGTNGTGTHMVTPPRAPPESEFALSTSASPSQRNSQPQPEEENRVLLIQEPPIPKSEKDEGEISDSDRSKSSSTSSDEDERKLTRNKRKKRRQAERETGGTESAQNLGAIFSKCYEYRFKIAERLTVQQKSQLLEILKQVKQGDSLSLQPQQQLMNAQLVNSLMNYLKSSSGQGV